MSIQGILLLDLLGLGLVILIVNLVRTQRLFVSYGIVWILSIIGTMVVISIPVLLEIVTRAVGAIFPASALSLLAFLFVILVLIYLSVQISVLSVRQVALAQAIALQRLLDEEGLPQNAEP